MPYFKNIKKPDTGIIAISIIFTHQIESTTISKPKSAVDLADKAEVDITVCTQNHCLQKFVIFTLHILRFCIVFMKATNGIIELDNGAVYN